MSEVKRARRAVYITVLVASFVGALLLSRQVFAASKPMCRVGCAASTAASARIPQEPEPVTTTTSPVAPPVPTPQAQEPPKAAPRIPAIDRRVILMHPPYNNHQRQVAMTCGFHDSCKRYAGRHPAYKSGDALDWNDNNGTVPETKAVFFSASAYSKVPGTRIASVSFTRHVAGRDRGFPCYTLVANVRSYPSRALLFRVMYQHAVPIRGLKSIPIYSGARGAVPNVVVRIATMVNDPCPFFTKKNFHVHVEPLDHNRRVAYARNITRHGRARVIPDVNGCGSEACNGPVYPGPRYRSPYYTLWTYRWTWYARSSTGAVLPH
ncbi:MAG: hypothetical protein ABR548_05025 [Actinomycetota bacterium]|nr:hypothetical protein [Actinomycetota bacterium]